MAATRPARELCRTYAGVPAPPTRRLLRGETASEMLIVVAVFDSVADRYDETRGGEPRGDAYAAQLTQWLAPGRAVLEVGAGTGVVALGLQRRGFRVVGVDASCAMLAKARNRLGPVVVRGDVGALPFRSDSFDQAVAVWVLHSVSDPSALFAEAVRVLRPAGRFLICPVNQPAPEDRVGQDFEAMGLLVDRVTGRPNRTATAAQILCWAEAAGFQGHIDDLAAQAWASTTDREIKAILDRTWSALVPLSNSQFDLVTADALATLRSLPPGPIMRRAVAEAVVLNAP